MKKVLITLVVVVLTLNLTAQKMHTVAWYNWSSPISYHLSPLPYITGYGYYSDSLAEAFDGTTFFEFNNEYYPIESWADYYYWYVNEYWYKFYNPELYEYYYRIKDDFQMARYIAGNSYRMRYYPSRIYVSFHHKKVEVNRLSQNSIYVALNDKQVDKLKRLDELAKKQSKNRHKPVYNPQVGNKYETLALEKDRKSYNNGNYNTKTINKNAKLNRYENKVSKSNRVNKQSTRNRTSSANYFSNSRNTTTSNKFSKQR